MSTPTFSSAIPLKRRGRTLAEEAVDALTQQIQSGGLKPGDKLPTEVEIMAALGVGRSVVREAISRLQANGLAETRHGIGTFIKEPPAESSKLRIAPSEIVTAIDVLAVLELRISLEADSAGLAALRRTPEQLTDIRRALSALRQAVAAGPESVSNDYEFHLAVARATNNRYFVEIMTHLGKSAIPRGRIGKGQKGQDKEQIKYIERLHLEHEDIFAAIERGDADGARAAMRMHLINSRERLRKAIPEKI